jgi:segregation and condensation protein B
MELAQTIEALLFSSGEALSVKRAARVLEVSDHQIREALPRVREGLSDRGIRLLQHGDEIELVSAPEAGRFVEKLRREELEGDLSQAALEVLAITLWKKSISRVGIDFLRGVNSSFTLRTLLVRGLIKRRENPNDARVALYEPTAATMKFLGITSLSDLPFHELINVKPEEKHEA